MSVTENDLESLEELLDGELPVELADQLRRRLSDEPELAQAMDRLRGDRQMRAAMWVSLEPSDKQVESVISSVRREVRKHELWSQRLRMFRSVSGIAAAIVMVFTAGWISSRRLQFGTTPQPGEGVAMIDQRATARTSSPSARAPLNPYPVVTAPRERNRPFDLSANPIANVSLDTLPLPQDPNNELFNGPSNGGNNAISNVRPAYNVVVIDPWGRIVDRQQFETRDDAQKFTEQLNRFQGRQVSPHRGGADNVVPVTDQP